MTADYLIRHCSELVCCFLLPGVPAATLFLHRGASVCVLLWAGLVRQARWSGVYKVPHGEAATYLGAAEPTHLSQGSAVCHDGPHWRGRNTVTSCFLHVSVLEAFTRGLRPCRILHKWRHLLGSTQNGAASVFLQPCLISSHSMHFHHKHSWMISNQQHVTSVALAFLFPWPLELWLDLKMMIIPKCELRKCFTDRISFELCLVRLIFL